MAITFLLLTLLIHYLIKKVRKYLGKYNQMTSTFFFISISRKLKVLKRLRKSWWIKWSLLRQRPEGEGEAEFPRSALSPKTPSASSPRRRMCFSPRSWRPWPVPSWIFPPKLGRSWRALIASSLLLLPGCPRRTGRKEE